jgi:hypothetical protein
VETGDDPRDLAPHLNRGDVAPVHRLDAVLVLALLPVASEDVLRAGGPRSQHRPPENPAK